MTKTAVLVSGGGATLQALLDQCYFDEIPGLEIAAVISSVRRLRAGAGRERPRPRLCGGAGAFPE